MKNGDIEQLPSRNPSFGQSATSPPPGGNFSDVDNYGSRIEFVAPNGPVGYKPSGCSQTLPSVTSVNVNASEHV
jgi:hypothetical protein